MKPLAFLALVLAAPIASPQLAPSRVQGSGGANAAVPESWLARVTEDIRREEYGFSPLDSGDFGAPNRAQELRSRVSAKGLEVFPRSVGADGEGAPWRLALRTRSFGRTDGELELGPAALEVRGERAELDHGPLVEWLENRTDGIEQGWTIAARPMGSEPLWIGLELSGDLALRIDEGGRSGILVDSTGEARLRYTGLRAFDATGRELEARLLPSPGGVGILVEDAGAAYPLTVDPLLTGGWTMESNKEGAAFGFSVSTAGDVNGDGYSDVIIGAMFFENGEFEEGRAYVYHGSASGPGTSPAWTAESNQESAQFGFSVSTAGDVNGDGYSDVIVGAYAFDNGQDDEGRAFVYHGSAGGLAASPAWTAEQDQAFAYFGLSVSTAGDVNGDGYSDVLVGAPDFDSLEGRAFLYLGSSSGLAANPAWTAESGQSFANFGRSVSTAGDVNGDGYSDVIVGARWFSNDQAAEGGAFVYHGSSSGLGSTPFWTAEGNQDSAEFGYSVSTAGDVNGDGYSDVIVGAPYFDNGQSDEGRVYVYHGSPSGLELSPATTAEMDLATALLGYSVSTAGDVNGDGYSDVIVGAPHFISTVDGGLAFVYQGSASGLATSPAWTQVGAQLFAEFGLSVSTAGDVNGDGYSDVIVGAPDFDNGQTDEGRAFLYHGSASGLAASAAWGPQGQPESGFGGSVSTAGDVNGDGYSDVIVGAGGFDNGETDEGRAYVYHGSSSGLASSPAWTAESNQAGAGFGSVATAGDVNGDGYSDVIVGAVFFENGQMYEGRAFVYHGSASGLASSPAWTAESDQVFGQFGFSVSTAGDVNGDGYSDVIVGAPVIGNGQLNEGRAYVYHGSANGLATNPAWTAESDQEDAFLGVSVSAAGDVNGDGYSDVIVGAHQFNNVQIDEGRAFVYHGSASGLGSSPAWTAESDQTDSEFGRSVSTAGDVNGDGYSDVVVGAMGFDNGETDEGRAFVYHGSASGLASGPAWLAEGDQDSANLGISASTAGDVNGDGYSDVIVGSHNFDNGQTDEGRAFVYHGSASGLSSSPTWTAESNSVSSYLGRSVSTAADVNGDGYSDVIVGAPNHDNAQGSAFVYLGNDGGGWIRAPQQRRFGGMAPIAVLGRSNAPNNFQIRASFERSLAGFAWATSVTPTVRLEWEAEPSLGGSFDGLGIQSGASQVVSGSPLTFDEIVTGLSPETPYRWRARLRTNNPLLPVSPWFSLAGDGRTETKVRTAASGARPRRR